MILIFSNEKDFTTDIVIDWLNFFKKKFVRVNFENEIENIYLDINDTGAKFYFYSKDKEINFDNIDSFWFRKSGLSFHKQYFKCFGNKNIEKLKKFVLDEEKIVISFLEYLLSKKKSIGYIRNKQVNKLIVLAEAVRLEIKVPYSLITNSKNLISLNRNYIIKAISELIFFNKRNKKHITYTKVINPIILDDFFNLSLFQKKIEKKFELRIFYLKGECYSMAIFSQNDIKTQVDFRRYNFKKPNRNVPFVIHDDLEVKIKKLMEKLELNTGSLDFIVDEKGDYYFLEVNPSGQFGMVSYPCNYKLEKKIANDL
jgi:ATP-GRASP peptide maturase of grasp-with-spasm system